MHLSKAYAYVQPRLRADALTPLVVNCIKN